MDVRLTARRIAPLFYFLAVSLPHHPASAVFDKDILVPAGFYTVQFATDVLSMIVLCGIVLLGVMLVRKRRVAALKHVAFWLVLIALMWIADHYLVVNNAERIHFPQYAVLALLLGLSLRSEVLILGVTSFAGFLDEFLQFVMNPVKTNYLDFNDIVLNILGAGFGIALLIALRRPPVSAVRKFEERFRSIFLFSISLPGLLAIAAAVTGRIVPLLDGIRERSVFADVNGRLSFILSFEKHDHFWIKSYFGKVFHILSPLEGGIVVIVILISLAWVSKALGKSAEESL